jgi:hypothetical protein
MELVTGITQGVDILQFKEKQGWDVIVDSNGQNFNKPYDPNGQ